MFVYLLAHAVSRVGRVGDGGRDASRVRSRLCLRYGDARWLRWGRDTSWRRLACTGRVAVCVLWWWCGLWCGGMTAVGRLMLVCRGARGCVRGCRRCRRLRADARWCCQARGRVVAVATYARRCDVCYCGGVFGGAWRAVALDGSGAVGASRRRVIVYSAVVVVIAEDTVANAVGMCVVLWRVGVARDAPLLVPYACTSV